MLRDNFYFILEFIKDKFLKIRKMFEIYLKEVIMGLKLKCFLEVNLLRKNNYRKSRTRDVLTRSKTFRFIMQYFDNYTYLSH